MDTDFSESNKEMVSLPQYGPVVSTVPMAKRLKDPPDSPFPHSDYFGGQTNPYKSYQGYVRNPTICGED